MQDSITMWGLEDADGKLVKQSISSNHRPYPLFDTRGQAEQYVDIHHSGFTPVEVQLTF